VTDAVTDAVARSGVQLATTSAEMRYAPAAAYRWLNCHVWVWGDVEPAVQNWGTAFWSDAPSP
jgi:hypothetical protein